MKGRVGLRATGRCPLVQWGFGWHEDEEADQARVALAGGRDGAFLHGLEQNRLRLERHSVDLVGKDDVGEQRTLHKLELARLIENLLIRQCRLALSLG